MEADLTARGAEPAGVEAGNESAAGRAVREMFARVAPRYDLLNHLLSGQVDRYWRWRLVRAVRPVLSKPGVRIADVCCGTADLAISLARQHGRLLGDAALPVVAMDFCRPMLSRAAKKARNSGLLVPLVEADASRMPLPDRCLDLIAIAYGFRNLASYRGGAKEFARLLAPGGCLAILEFSEPTSRVWGMLFNAYFRHLLPRLGNVISGSGGAYSYLLDSVQRFPPPDEICRLLLDAGFARVETLSLTGGVSMLYLAYL